MVRTPGQKVKHSKQGNKKSLAEVIEGSAAVLHMKDSMEEKKEEEEELVMDISFEFPFGEQPEGWPSTLDPMDEADTAEAEERMISMLESTLSDIPSPCGAPGVADMEDLVGRYPWTPQFTAFSSPYSGYTTERAAAEALIQEYSQHMNTKFSINTSSGVLRKPGADDKKAGSEGGDGHTGGEQSNRGKEHVRVLYHVYFEKLASRRCAAIPYDGVPFTVDGYQLLEAKHSKAGQKKQSERYRSTVTLRAVARYPQFKVNKKDEKQCKLQLKKLRHILKEDIPTEGLKKEVRYYIDLHHMNNDEVTPLSVTQVGEADDTVVASGGGVEEEDQPQQAMPTRDATRMQDTDLTISQPDGNGKSTQMPDPSDEITNLSFKVGEVYSWASGFHHCSTPYSGYTLDLEAAETIIGNYIHQSQHQYNIRRNVGQMEAKGARKCKGAIYFCRPSSQYVSAIQNEGVPFVIPAQRHLFCCWTCTTQTDHSYVARVPDYCNANIALQRVVFFPEYKVDSITKLNMKASCQQLRAHLAGGGREDLATEVRYYIDIKADHWRHDDQEVMESKGMAHHILEGMNLLRFNSQLCDVTLVVGEARLQAHRVVLAGASPIFAALFQKEMEVDTLEVSGVLEADIQCALDFIYTGKITLKCSNVASIHNLAIQLHINLLAELCAAFKAKYQPSQAVVTSAGVEGTTGDCRLLGGASEGSTQADCLQTDLSSHSKLAECAAVTSTHSCNSECEVDLSGGSPSSVLGLQAAAGRVGTEGTVARMGTGKKRAVEIVENGEENNEDESSMEMEDAREEGEDGREEAEMEGEEGREDAEMEGDGREDAEMEGEGEGRKTRSGYICEWCRRTCLDKDGLYGHAIRCHRDIMYKCGHCLQKFASRPPFEEHVSVCVTLVPICGRYKCPTCIYDATERNLVVTHYLSVHYKKYPRKKRACKVCKKDISIDSYYEHLLRIHGRDVSLFKHIHKCGKCSFKTTRIAHLHAHQDVHDPRPSKCQVCGKVMSCPETLRKHHRKLHGTIAISYSCHVCTYHTGYKAQLEQHQFSKHGLLPTPNHKVHSCSQCSQTFLMQGQLNTHVKQKHNGRHFQCTDCPKAFRTKRGLTTHETQSNHGDGGPRFVCCHCPYYASRSSASLYSHVRKKHHELQPFKCKYCGLTFMKASSYKKHGVICTQKVL